MCDNINGYLRNVQNRKIFKDNQQFVTLVQRMDAMSGNFSPEIEVSDNLEDDLTTQYQRTNRQLEFYNGQLI